MACNVSDAASVEAAVAAVVEQLGGIDVLVNNAGVTRDNLLFKMTEEDWDAVMGVHLKGSFLMSREVQKHMVAAKYGKILNLSSVSALGNRGQANYSAAKMGLQGFTRTLALELGPFGINVNAIAPGFIVTDMTDATARRVGMEPEDLPRGGRRGDPGAPGRPPRGHRGHRCVPVQRRGLVHHRPDALRRRRRQGLSTTRHAAGGGRRRRPPPAPHWRHGWQLPPHLCTHT